MSIYLHYAEILDGEARRHQRLSDLAEDLAMKDAHAEVMLALWTASDLLRKEATKSWNRCPKSATKRRLSLKPFSKGVFLRASEQSPVRWSGSTHKDDFTSLR